MTARKKRKVIEWNSNKGMMREVMIAAFIRNKMKIETSFKQENFLFCITISRSDK